MHEPDSIFFAILIGSFFKTVSVYFYNNNFVTVFHAVVSIRFILIVRFDSIRNWCWKVKRKIISQKYFPPKFKRRITPYWDFNFCNCYISPCSKAFGVNRYPWRKSDERLGNAWTVTECACVWITSRMLVDFGWFSGNRPVSNSPWPLNTRNDNAFIQG